jgi:hypothetical protein
VLALIHDPPIFTSQAGITDVSHCTQPQELFLFPKFPKFFRNIFYIGAKMDKMPVFKMEENTQKSEESIPTNVTYQWSACCSDGRSDLCTWGMSGLFAQGLAHYATGRIRCLLHFGGVRLSGH